MCIRDRSSLNFLRDTSKNSRMWKICECKFRFFSLSWSRFDRVDWSDTSPVWNRPARKISLYYTRVNFVTLPGLETRKVFDHTKRNSVRLDTVKRWIKTIVLNWEANPLWVHLHIIKIHSIQVINIDLVVDIGWNILIFLQIIFLLFIGPVYMEGG